MLSGFKGDSQPVYVFLQRSKIPVYMWTRPWSHLCCLRWGMKVGYRWSSAPTWGFHMLHILCAVHLKTIKGIFLPGLFPWRLYFIGQYTLERVGADGERIRRDKGPAPCANPPGGLRGWPPLYVWSLCQLKALLYSDISHCIHAITDCWPNKTIWAGYYSLPRGLISAG